MMGTDLDAIRHRINAGDREGARLELEALLAMDSDNPDAWALLAILLREPTEQAECYRQILRIEPENRQAAAWLNALQAQIRETAAPERPSQSAGMTLKCQECGGITEVRFVGELRDRRAFCPYCGSRIDLSDALAGVEPVREQEQLPEGGIRRPDALFAEKRREPAPGEQPLAGMDEIDRMLQDLEFPDAGDEAVGQVRDRGSVAGAGMEGVRSTRPRREDRGLLDRLLGRSMPGTEDDEGTPDLVRGEETSQSGSLSPEDILRLAGGPLPEEERRECPGCAAIVSRNERRCPWCNAWLPTD